MNIRNYLINLMKSTKGLVQTDYYLIGGMVTLALLGASTVLVHTTPSFNLNDMTYRIKDDLSYVRSLTSQMYNLQQSDVTLENRDNFRYRIDFSSHSYGVCSGINKYTIIVDSDNNGVWGENPNSLGITESAYNPFTTEPIFCVNMSDGTFSGFKVDVDFDLRPDSTSEMIEFDLSSTPFFIDKDGNSHEIKENIAIEVTDSQAFKTIILKPRIGSTTVLN